MHQGIIFDHVMRKMRSLGVAQINTDHQTTSHAPNAEGKGSFSHWYNKRPVPMASKSAKRYI